MKISIPGLPSTPFLPSTVDSVEQAVEKIGQMLSRNARPLVLTGAGVSVDSGIKSYRGKDGTYCK